VNLYEEIMRLPLHAVAALVAHATDPRSEDEREEDEPEPITQRFDR
jgi:hypothetical protein